MNKLILLTILAIQLNLMAQEIIPIPVDTTSVWRIERNYNDESCIYIHNSIYYIEGKEIKNEKEYYKIYEEGHYWEEPTHPWDTTCTGEQNYSGEYLGGIRTENGKVYGYTTWQDTPSLLMDFTLNVGDTLFSSISYQGKIIESIDSVLVGFEYRKRFNFTGNWYCNWMIEGVGHERGLFESMDEPFENGSELICYGENGTPIFGDENCDITVGLLENSSSINRPLIYPNPSSGKFTINATELTNTIKSYILADIYGKIILQKNIDLFNYNVFEIDLSKYRTGIYFLRLHTENQGIITSKIIKK